MSRKLKVLPPEHEYQLNLNEAMLYAIQSTTGHASHKIISFFYDVAVKQKDFILRSEKEVENKERRYEIVTAKHYGFYPGTSIYFVASMQQTTYNSINEQIGNWHKVFGQHDTPRKYIWVVNISFPTNAKRLDNAQIQSAIGDGFLVGEELNDLPSPHNTKRQKLSVERLLSAEEPSTDSKSEGQEG